MTEGSRDFLSPESESARQMAALLTAAEAR